MSAPVDVLAVLDNATERLGSTVYAPELREARAAVAELIAASRRAERLLRDMAEAGFGDPAQADGLRTALARIGGAA